MNEERTDEATRTTQLPPREDAPQQVAPGDAPTTAPAAAPQAPASAPQPDHTRAMGTRVIPVTATEPAPQPSHDEAIARLERGLRQSRIIMALLAVAVVALLAVVILLASGVLDPSAQAPSQGATIQTPQGAQPDGQDGEDADSSLGGVIIDGLLGGDEEDSQGNGQVQINPDGEAGSGTNTGAGVAGADRLMAADIVDIVGEKWSNAQRILEALGVDVNELVVITDDGGRVINASNWTVTRVVDLVGQDAVAVYLRHDIDLNPLNWLGSIDLGW